MNLALDPPAYAAARIAPESPLDDVAAREVEAALRTAVESRRPASVDLGAVPRLTWPGIRMLVESAQRALERGSRLRVTRLDARTRRLFKTTGIDLLMDL